jgi:hypothetical protein
MPPKENFLFNSGQQSGRFDAPEPPAGQARYLGAAAISASHVPCDTLRGTTMRKLLVAALIAGSVISFEAKAQERAGSAALGAVSGAIVLGPVGAVAGALIGYTAGPAIAHSWGVGHSASRSSARRVTQASAATQEAAAKVTPLPVAKPAEAVAGKSAPPVAKMPEIVASKTAPDVQGFE